MKLHEFLYPRRLGSETNLPAVAEKKAVDLVSAKLPEYSQKNEAMEVAAAMAGDKELMCELSERLGTPEQDETEEEFVARGKSELKALLRKKWQGVERVK
ncbi:hypothetical protein [Salinicola sp. DM10]|uniref:hypothetical protein n=1 Tax=Salinicola sp. DM10 TaxID=2815721 RepID=UPI001A9012B6|nr:hypothetical protein [Salinicola sp. DM10]MCE3025746.1 hypothetical protein [Salinicola sp. DM10]